MTPSKSILAGLLFLMAVLLQGAQDSLALARTWLPLRVGDRWTYEGEILSGDRQHPTVEKWEQRDTTVAVQLVPEGVLIRRKVEVLSGSTRPQRESDVLVHNNCLYYLNDSQVNGLTYRPSEMSSEFVRDSLPDVCLPLRTGKIWGDAKKYRESWKVAGFGRKRTDDPQSVTSSAWRMEAHLSSGDDNYVWFQRGIGVTAQRVYHNGTYNDYRARLVRYEPGRAK